MTSAADMAVRDWELERYRLGELSQEARERIDLLLAADPALRERLSALDVSDRELFERVPPRLFAAEVRERVHAAGQDLRRRRWRPNVVWLGAAATVVLAAGLFLVTRGARLPDDGDRIKGLRPHVLLFKKTASGAERLAPASLVRERDVIQLAYQAAGRRYGVIVSVDARGVVTRHLPAAGAAAAKLKRGTVALPDAYQLDDAPRWECFYLVTADAPFDVAAVVDAARRAAIPGAREPALTLDLPARFDQEVFVLRKETRS